MRHGYHELMYERDKLHEAAYFLDRMQAVLGEPDAFKYNVSAFLSAARSVAQYARKDASSKHGGQSWYVRFVEDHHLIRFSVSERNANVHERPVDLGGHVDVYVSDVVSLTGSSATPPAAAPGTPGAAVGASPGPPQSEI